MSRLSKPETVYAKFEDDLRRSAGDMRANPGQRAAGESDPPRRTTPRSPGTPRASLWPHEVSASSAIRKTATTRGLKAP